MNYAKNLGITPPPTGETFLRVAKSISLTNEYAMIPDDSKYLWRLYPSIVELRDFTSPYTGEKKRKCDQSPKCTHYMEVAHELANCPELQHYPREVLAFIGYAHDLVEDFGRKIMCDDDGKPLPLLTPEYIVKSCWKGDKSFIPLITKCIELLTDPFDLVGEARLSYQPFIANTDATKIVRYARYYDKKCTYVRDLACYTHGGFPQKADPDEAIYNMNLRIGVVEGLHICERYKLEFRDITDRIKWIINNRDKITDENKEAILGSEFRTNGLPPYAFHPLKRTKIKQIIRRPIRFPFKHIIPLNTLTHKK